MEALEALEAASPPWTRNPRLSLPRLPARARAGEKADVSLPLGGVPIAIKDVINVKGEPCTCGSKMLKGYTLALRRHGHHQAARRRRDSLDA